MLLFALPARAEAGPGERAGERPGQAGGEEPDDALVARALADPRSFGPLYERYHDRIYRYCYTRLGARDAAEDATAEAFLKALANLRQYRRGTVFAAWLYTIARHAVADSLAKRRPASPWEDAATGAAVVSSAASTGHLDRAALAEALGRLAEEQRAVVDLQLAGWTGAETAAALGKSVAAVKMLRYRAMERLHQLLRVEG